MKLLSCGALIVTLTIAACADRSNNAPGNIQSAEPTTAAGTMAPTARLGALTAADIAAADLSGELACGFTDEGGATVFHATGNVGSSRVAEAIIKLGGTVTHVTAPGGFDRMQRGTTFASPVTKVRIGDVGGAQGEGESPPRPATLTWTAGDGTQGSIVGRWTCGP